MIDSYLLTWMIFLPLLGSAILLFLPSGNRALIRWVSVVFTGIPLILASYLFLSFDRGTSAMQFVERYTWIEKFNIQYFLGVDGISVTMVLLTSLLSFLCVFASFN